MAVSIATLPVVSLDYTNRGPGLHTGLARLEAMLADTSGREGFLAVNVTVGGGVIPIILARSDLYVIGFQCDGNWFHFDDADWPFSEAGTKLGYAGQYSKLGGLGGNLTANAIDGISRLTNINQRPQWKASLRTLLVVVSECARLVPVRMQVLGLLNGYLATMPFPSVERYIKNWDKASKGKDMSRETGPNLRVGFKDPTIIKR